MASVQTNPLDFSHLIWDEKMQEMERVLKSGGSWYDLVLQDQEARLQEVEHELEQNQRSKKSGRWRIAAALAKERAELRVALGLESSEILENYQPTPPEIMEAYQRQAEAEAAATPQKSKPQVAPSAPKKPQVTVGRFGAFLDSDTE